MNLSVLAKLLWHRITTFHNSSLPFITVSGSQARFTDIRPGFVATPLLSGDGRYPMLMRTEKVAARIMHVLRHPRRRVVIDRRYALMVFFWKLIPEWLWERLNIRKDD